MSENTTTNTIYDVLAKYERVVYEFLDFTKRICGVMQYLRDQTAESYLIDKGLKYEDADFIIQGLLNENILDNGQYGAFPGMIFTSKGEKLFDFIKERLGPIEQIIDFNKYTKKEETYTTPHIWGAHRSNLDQEKIDKELKEIQITDEQAYRFLKFELNVMKSTGVNYVREIVSEDYLRDAMKLSYEKTDRFITLLMEKGFLENDQYGAFPGTSVSDLGKQYFEMLKKKFEKSDPTQEADSK